MLGPLYLEGKLAPRDVQEAMRLIGQAGTWNLDEAAEFGEPDAMTILIDLKLSKNPRFQDRPGACKLIETAAQRGDQAMTERLAECRAN